MKFCPFSEEEPYYTGAALSKREKSTVAISDNCPALHIWTGGSGHLSKEKSAPQKLKGYLLLVKDICITCLSNGKYQCYSKIWNYY